MTKPILVLVGQAHVIGTRAIGHRVGITHISA